MRIAFVYDLIYPYSKGGVEKWIADLAVDLASRGHETHVFGAKHWQGPDHLVVDGVNVHGIPSSSRFHDKSGRRSIWQGATFALRLVGQLRTRRFDVIDIQAMAPLTCLSALVMSRMTRTPTVVSWSEVWGPYWTQYLGPLGYVGRLVEWLISRLGVNHIAISPLTLRRLIDLGVDHAEYRPIGVDLDRLGRVTSQAEPKGIAYVGRIVPHKNLTLLIDALMVLQRRGMTPRVSIVGDGPNRREMERRARPLINVSFLGELDSEDEVWATLKGARVLALPSLREGFGLVALEALALGTPVITVDHPANAAAEMIGQGGGGLIVATDPELLADALQRVLVEDDLYESLSAKGRVAVEAFDLTAVVDRVEGGYERLLAASHA